MKHRRHDSPPISPLEGDTPRDAWEETLGRAIDAGHLDPALAAADPKLAGVFAAHQKLESLFALLRGQPADQPEPTPTQLGRYQVQSTLGAGAFGTVYLARDPELNRDVAIKVSRSRTFTSADALDKFRAEARHAASLNHPQIVGIHDVGRDGERLYIVMHYVRGRTLADLMGEGPLAPTRAAELLAAVADALNYAHKLGFVHRDLKPTNILLDEQGRPHVADFGLAVSEETQRVLAGQVAGTPEYMAPEQVRGESHRLDGRTDVWALGVMLYESLAGRRPFAGPSIHVVFDEIEHRDPKPPRQIDDALPAELERICLKCLAKRMTDRYSTTADVAADLRHFQAQPDSPKSVPLNAARQGTAAQRPDSDSSSPAVVPKGLRSFDAHDSDFFLQLLPGPTDREGLPESLRFWKTRIEQTDADATFAVGLLYGPSGCGKSSLMKAGLLPRLAPHVLPVYLEATADETESRLLKALRKRLPGLAAGDLAAAIAELRSGAGLPTGNKLLIVLDQFEQWLHAHSDPQGSELVRALRQCDGGHVQCVVMVRDDFWLAASQFSRELEIRLVEGENSAAVYLFDERHARRVLTLFGRAYGCLSPTNDPSAEQSRFIEQAAGELADNGRVIPVRLALFAEMVKGKSWLPATLKQIGGIAGVGLTFLEETFSTTTAPPPHRLHQKAAQAVLKALLPQVGADIRGHKRSQAELLEASGYAGRPQDFAELIRILDAELRLITPTDPEGADTATPAPRGTATDKYYQLTHDYLVPSLRDWLTRKQRETRRGRAELRLAERAAAYNARPDPRNLPGWWEWPNLLLFTRPRNWTVPERRVMRAAGRRRGLQALLVAALVATGTLAGREARRRVNDDRDRVKADGIVQRLLVAPLESLPAVADELESYRGWTDPKLHQVLADGSKGNVGQRLRASIGLLRVDPAQAEPVYEAMFNATHGEARVLIDALEPYRSRFAEQLWQILANQDAPPASRLRAAMALATFAPPETDRRRWEIAAPVVTDMFLSEAWLNPSQYPALEAAFRPVSQVLLPSLATAFRDARRLILERDAAATVLGAYVADDPTVLVDMITDAQAKQFLTLFPMLEKHSAAAGLLAAELDKRATFNWRDPPLDPSWRPPAESTVIRIEAGGGMLAERFALVQTLPLDDFSALAEELRSSGYRPLRCRPYAVGDQLWVAGVWTRDAIDWKCALGIEANELLTRNVELHDHGYVPIDLAGYTTERGDRFAVLWSLSAGDGDVRPVDVDLPDLASAKAVPADSNKSQENDFRPASLQAYKAPDGTPRYTVIWRKGMSEVDWESTADKSLSHFEGATATDRLQLDISFLVAASAPLPKRDAAPALAAAERALADNPDDLSARYQRGIARYDAGDDAGAIEDLTVVAEKQPQFANSFFFRASAHARLKHDVEARADVKKFAELAIGPKDVAYLDAVVSARLGEVDEGLARLEAAIECHAADASFLYDAAGAYSVVAELIRDNLEKVAKLKRRAVELLKLAIRDDSEVVEYIQSNSDFDNVREMPEFQEVVAVAHLEQRYAAVFETNAMFVSVSPHGLSPDEHLKRCRELAGQGYRPAAISLGEALDVKDQGAGVSTRANLEGCAAAGDATNQCVESNDGGIGTATASHSVRYL